MPSQNVYFQKEIPIESNLGTFRIFSVEIHERFLDWSTYRSMASSKYAWEWLVAPPSLEGLRDAFTGLGELDRRGPNCAAALELILGRVWRCVARDGLAARPPASETVAVSTYSGAHV
jgi:hypothetical protein